MKIVAFGASTSKQSINKQLAGYAASLVDNAQVEVIDLNDYELPLFSEDKETEVGQPEAAKAFVAKMAEADALVISFAEHNSNFAAAYKNLLDWCSRVDRYVFQQTPAVFLATSPGARGGQTALELAVSSAKRFGADVKAQFSLPSFSANFDTEAQQVSDEALNNSLKSAMAALHG